MSEILAQIEREKEYMDFTRTERKILEVLSDGRRHLKAELKECLFDELSQDGALHKQICMIRKKLNPRGEELICEYYQRRIHYRWVRLLKIE